MKTETMNKLNAVLVMLNEKVSLKVELKAQGRPFGHVDQGIERMFKHLENLGVSSLMIQDARADIARLAR